MFPLVLMRLSSVPNEPYMIHNYILIEVQPAVNLPNNGSSSKAVTSPHNSVDHTPQCGRTSRVRLSGIEDGKRVEEETHEPQQDGPKRNAE